MRNTNSEKQNSEDADMLPEYDFRGGVRGKHHKAYRRGHTVKISRTNGSAAIHHFTPQEDTVILDPDVREYFPDSESVNNALRSLIMLIPQKQKAAIARTGA